MVNNEKGLNFLQPFILFLMLIASCSSPSAEPIGITPQPIAFTQTPAQIITNTQKAHTTTPTIASTITAIPPTGTPLRIPKVNILIPLSSLPTGQYLLYWNFSGERYCRINAVSMDQKVYDLIDTECGFGPDFGDTAVLSANGRFLLIPFFNNRYLIDLTDDRTEMLSPSQRDDCVITSVSWDGTRFAGRCGSFETSFELAVRTINSDWVILQPFEPDDQGDVTFTIAWSPDGKMLAFNKATSLTRGVYVIDVDQCLNDRSTCASQVKGLYLEDTSDYLLWSPDGKQLAVTIAREFMIYDVNSTQSWLIKIKNEGVLIHGAAWSLDGKWIGYAVDKGQNLRGVDTYIISPNGGTVSFLTDKDVIQVVGWLNIGP